MKTNEKSNIGIVIIGRNEGKRLEECFHSVVDENANIVYIDSQSVDNSLQIAKFFEIPSFEVVQGEVVTAANARNFGSKKISELYPETEYLQFIDGDSKLFPGWLEKGKAFLKDAPSCGIVFGKVQEFAPDANIFHRIASLEWQKQEGETNTCGGLFMIKKEVFDKIGGFNPRIVAGEDDDFCLRIRSKGLKILHLNETMAIHNIAMDSFKQWWRRSFRSGHAYAQVFSLHKMTSESFYAKEIFSSIFWGGLLPATALLLAPFTSLYSLLLLIAYPLQFFKITVYAKRNGWNLKDSILYSAFCILGKFPNLLGIIKYYIGNLKNSAPKIIEYKGHK